MKTVQRVGPYIDIVEARSPENPVNVVKVGVRSDSFQGLMRQHLFTTVAQYYGIVQDGILDAKHAFMGLNRPLMHAGDMEADRNVIVYSWRPKIDYTWTGGRFEGAPIPKNPPPNRVFVVLVRQENQPDNYPGFGSIFGSIERWNWVTEDPDLQCAPVDWNHRYKQKLWSRNS
jgi:hypothetical protein